MIKANELRIGNFITDDENRIMQVCSIGKSGYEMVVDLKLKIGYGRFVLAHLNPIPLTPEILEKAGFVKSIELKNGGWLYWVVQGDESDFNIQFHNGEATLQVENCNYGNPFKYLHQLQNLYFSLIGEELQINL